MNKSIKDFLYEIEVLGFSLFENIVPSELLERLRGDIEKHEKFCQSVREKNGINDGMEGSAHHIIGQNDSLDDFL